MSKKKVWKEIISWIIVVAAAIGLAFLINKTIIYKISSPTPSMEATFMVDDKVVVFRLAYLFHGPERGDIVVFKNPEDAKADDYIKRVIGLPGETVEGKDGVVYINGKPLKEDYFNEKPEGDFGPYVVPKDSYFMMGDNRNISFDSRYWADKYVLKKDIYGKALFKYPDFKWLYHHSYD